MAIVAWLKQSTATTLLLGPFLDETDGKTAETALTLSQSDVLLWKEGGTTLAQKNESTSCTHRSNGLYTCPIDATDTGTLGVLSVSVHESGALPIRQDYLVVPANIYDALVAGTAYQRVDPNHVEWSIAGTTLTVLAPDGSTTAYTKTLSSTPGADPITGVS
jgi:hypothetical protein